MISTTSGPLFSRRRLAAAFSLGLAGTAVLAAPGLGSHIDPLDVGQGAHDDGASIRSGYGFDDAHGDAGGRPAARRAVTPSRTASRPKRPDRIA